MTRVGQRAVALAVSLAIVGCATSSKNIAPAYVSLGLYTQYDCQQLQYEAYRIQSRVTQLGGRLDEAAMNDAGIMGIALVLFWPAIFFLGGTKAQEAEYARLKGEYDAVEQAVILKKCPFVVVPSSTIAATSPSTGQVTSSQISSPAIAPQPPPEPAASAPPMLSMIPPPNIPPNPLGRADLSPTAARPGGATPVVAGIKGESKYLFQAESIAKVNGCSPPTAAMTSKGAGMEMFAIACPNGTTLAVRCEVDGCRVLR